MIEHGQTDQPGDAAAPQRCHACQTPVATEDHFCEVCGADQRVWRADTEHPLAGGISRPPGCVLCGSAEIGVEGYCEVCGQRQPRARDRVEIDLGAVAAVSDRGLRHDRNEDAFAVGCPRRAATHGVVAVVCDGVSTSDRPHEASQVAAVAAADVLLAALQVGEEAELATRRAVVAAADAVAALAEPGYDNAPACTVVSAVVTTDTVTIGWIGDSRAYWLAASEDTPTAQLTFDDSWANQLITEGVSELEAYTDVNAHALAGWLGADAPQIRPHVTNLRPGAPGAVLLCSDGLWNYLPEAAELAAAALPAACTAPLAAARALTAVAIDGGGADNITAVLVPFPPVSSVEGQRDRNVGTGPLNAVTPQQEP